MKNIMFFLLLFSAFIVNVNAQIIEGVVLDSATKEPLSFATIYFEGTTIGTTTNANGKFLLTLKNRIFANLIVSSIGYESEIVEPPFDSIPRTIYLKEKAFSLGEVTVTGKQIFSREQKLKAFKEQLLGSSKGGKRSIIKSVKFLNAEEVFFQDETISDSSMFFRTGTFNIDSYGNTDLNKNLFLNGTMGMQRLGDQLPLDYLPPS